MAISVRRRKGRFMVSDREVKRAAAQKLCLLDKIRAALFSMPTNAPKRSAAFDAFWQISADYEQMLGVKRGAKWTEK